MSWSQLFNAAGGLPYHWRALRNQGTLWAPFRTSIAGWLEHWQPPEKQLILVGPSAGYTLPLIQLQRWTKLSILEPDPLACWLLERRLSAALGAQCPELEFVREDHLLAPARSLIDLATLRQPAAILFCNVLGQVTQLLPSRAQEQRLRALKQQVRAALVGRSWASYHDRVSGPIAPQIQAVTVPGRWSDAEVITHAYDAASTTTRVELVDHQTQGYFPEDLPHAYFSWPLQRGAFHLIEAVMHSV